MLPLTQKSLCLTCTAWAVIRRALPAGYEGFLNIKEGRTRRSAIKKDDRLFSNSSATGSRHLADLAPAEPAPEEAPAPEMAGAPAIAEAAGEDIQ